MLVATSELLSFLFCEQRIDFSHHLIVINDISGVHRGATFRDGRGEGFLAQNKLGERFSHHGARWHFDDIVIARDDP